MEFKTIKVATIPGTTTEVNVAKNATLQDVFAEYENLTGNKVEGYDVRINGADAAMTVIPTDGTKVCLVQKVKGRA